MDFRSALPLHQRADHRLQVAKESSRILRISQARVTTQSSAVGPDEHRFYGCLRNILPGQAFQPDSGQPVIRVGAKTGKIRERQTCQQESGRRNDSRSDKGCVTFLSTVYLYP